MNEARFSWAQLAALVVILAFCFGMSALFVKVLIPAAVAQIGGNVQIVNQVNTALQDRDKRLEKLETEVKTIKEMTKAK